MKKTNLSFPTKHSTDRLSFLILSCSGGAGHIRAAEALHSAAPLSGLPIRTEHYDVLNFTSRLFKRFYSESYIQMVNRAPELWGYLYQHSERKPYAKRMFLTQFDRLNYKRYLQKLSELRPDAIICTHFLPYISISSELRRHNINAPVFAATTDFDIHQLWIDPIIERYFVFNKESAWQLRSKSVPEDKINVTGIPVMPEFQSKEKAQTVRRELGFSLNQFTLLVLSGGFGIGRVKDIVKQIASTLNTFPKRKFTLLVVCGKNDSVRAEVQAVCFPKNVDPHIFGFVTNIHKLMDASDVLISKAGGLTSSEAMAKSLPILIIDPIPGQESRNADLIVEHGAGWKAMNLANLSYKLQNILKTPTLLTKAQTATLQLAKPEAATIILTDVYDFLSNRKKPER
jgi:processive 1,2-diacylglycerol beta-glucosyltransferase